MEPHQSIRWRLARTIYQGRKREAWGLSFRDEFPDLDDAKAMRAYSHNPVAEVDLALAAADEVLRHWTLLARAEAG